MYSTTTSVPFITPLRDLNATCITMKKKIRIYTGDSLLSLEAEIFFRIPFVIFIQIGKGFRKQKDKLLSYVSAIAASSHGAKCRPS